MREMDNGRTYHQRDRFLRDVVRAENHFAFFGHARRSVYFCLPRNTQQLKEDKDGWMIAVVTDDSNRRKETRNWVDSVVGCRTGRLLGLLYNVLLRKSHWQGGHFSRWCYEMVAFDLVLAPFNERQQVSSTGTPQLLLFSIHRDILTTKTYSKFSFLYY